MSRKIKIDSFGIEIVLTGDGGGSISSDLHEPERKNAYTESELKKVWNEFRNEETKVNRYNDMMDALEAILLAHAIAGVDVTTPAYLEGIESACQGCAKATE